MFSVVAYDCCCFRLFYILKSFSSTFQTPTALHSHHVLPGSVISRRHLHCDGFNYQSGDILYFSDSQQIPWKDPNSQMNRSNCKKHYISAVYLPSSSSEPQSSIVVQILLKTHRWATLLYWVTCSFITMSTHTVVYFGSILHTRAPNVDSSAADNSPQEIHCFLLFV